MDKPIRCSWLTNDETYIKYHDEEWGRPMRDKLKLFEMICLEGQQAGLSWKTILDKRENYRKAFFKFNPCKIALMKNTDIEKLMKNDGIVRHRAKIKSIINNAKAYLALEQNGVDFSSFIWSFVNNETVVNNWKAPKDVPAQTEVSAEMAKSLKKKGFNFVGSTICYAFMQACGLVDDHLVDCIVRKNVL